MPALIQQNVLLAPYTTLGVGGCAEFFAEVLSLDELRDVVLWARGEGHAIAVLGGGSNMLVREEGVKGLVIHMITSGVVYEERSGYATVIAEAGVVLDTLIAECVKKELWGLENLSAIPGTVGAVPVQNVGAYGVEAKDIISSVEVYDTLSHTMYEFKNEECQFAYRDSIFKKQEGKNFIITKVAFRLSALPEPRVTYKELAQVFQEITPPALRDIRDAVISIRAKKMPDWSIVGTAGSFFKNPIITREKYEALTHVFPGLPGYPENNGSVKLSLGWILDKVCGLKGYTEGNVGLHSEQALILVCTKGITASEIELFVQKIISLVFEKTGVVIEQEVRVLE